MKKILVLISFLCLICVTCGAQSKSSASKKRSISSSIKDSITTTEKKNNTTKSILNNYYDENGYLLIYRSLPRLKGYNPNKPILVDEEQTLNYILSNIHLVKMYEFIPMNFDTIRPDNFKFFNFIVKNGKVVDVQCEGQKYINKLDTFFYNKIRINQKGLTNFYLPIYFLTWNNKDRDSCSKLISLKNLQIIGIDRQIERKYDSIRIKNEIKYNFKIGKYKALRNKDLSIINRINLTYNTTINPYHCILTHNDHIIDTTKIEREINYGCERSIEEQYRFKSIFNYSKKNKIHLKNGIVDEENVVVFYDDSSFLTFSIQTNPYRNLSYSPIIIRLNNSFIFNKQDTIPGSYLIQNPLFKDSLIFIHSAFQRDENPFQLIKIESYKKVKTFRFGFFKRSYLLELKINGSFPKMVDSSIYLYVSKKGKKSIVKNKILDVFQVMSKSDSLKTNYYEIRYNFKINYLCDSVNVRLSAIGIQNNILIPEKYNHSKNLEVTPRKANLITRKIVGYIYYSPLNFYYKSINYLKYQCRVGFNAKKNDPTGKYKNPIIYYLEKGL